MSSLYRIIGSELSPFSVKIRSWFRFKGIDHEWIVASAAARTEFQEHFRIPVIPVVITPNGTGMQDSTPIIEKLESVSDGPTMDPADPALRFVSCLLEEFGDEWANKWMFHFRWARPVDQRSAALRIAAMREPDVEIDALTSAADAVIERMTGRVWFVGSNEHNARHIENGFSEALSLLDAHLASRAYLLGDRPAFADFGLAPQIQSAATDPSPGALILARFNHVLAWLQRMMWPRVEGDFESLDELAPTLTPFLASQVGARFLPWSLANREALKSGAESFSVELAGHTWTQRPQKYHAKSLAALQQKFNGLVDRQALDPILGDAGCLQPLLALNDGA
ncbi:MAG: glutathione S-transferase family protein [Pseudomonadota bacterium]